MRKLFGILTVLWLCCFAVSAAEFIASVSAQSLEHGEAIRLQLQLFDAKEKKPPNFDELLDKFEVLNSYQQQSMQSINGKITRSKTWILDLLPMQHDQVIIPEINIETNQGVLTSQKLAIEIKSTNAGQATNNNNKNNIFNKQGLAFVVEPQVQQPYVNQAFIVKVKLLSTQPFKSVFFNLSADIALVDKCKEIFEYQDNKSGQTIYMVENVFAVTPYKHGELTLKNIHIEGEREVINKGSQFNSLFGFFGKMMFDSAFLEPFSLDAPELQLQVMPKAANDTMWLPAESLTYVADSFPENIYSGETLQWHIKIEAMGALAKQLPDITKMLHAEGLQVYAEPAQLEQKISRDNIYSSRQQELALAFNSPGTIKLPDLQVPWWDVKLQQAQVLTIPGKVIQVMASQENDASLIDNQQIKHINPVKAEPRLPPLYRYLAYSVALVVILLCAIIVILWRKVNSRNIVTRPTHKISPEDNTVNNHGSGAGSPVELLKTQVLSELQNKYRVKSNSLALALEELSYQYSYPQQEMLLWLQAVQQALYFDGNGDIDELRHQWQRLKVQIKAKKIIEPRKPINITLNPN